MLSIKRFYLHNRLKNYNYCLVDQSNHALVIDPTDAQKSIRFCLDNQLIPTQIWITHEDLDHYVGANETSLYFNIPVYCPVQMTHHFDQAIAYSPLDTLSFSGFEFSIKHVPGHTPLHHVFLEKNQKWLISGDIIFNYGMGRVRQDQYSSMFDAINWLKSLNDDCIYLNAHDYDLENLSFAKALNLNPQKVEKIINAIEHFDHIDRPMSTLGEQKELNPFFNTSSNAIINELTKHNLPNSNELDVFTSIRKWRDEF